MVTKCDLNLRINTKHTMSSCKNMIETDNRSSAKMSSVQHIRNLNKIRCLKF